MKLTKSEQVVINAAPQTGHDADDDFPGLDRPQELRAYFEREGYVVLRNALPAPLCEAAKQAFLNEVHPDRRGFFKRHESGIQERHVLTPAGLMKYPVVNFQDISSRKYPTFKRRGLALLTDDVIQRAVAALLGEPGRMVHTMYFDGNQTTWAHRDGDYFGSRRNGTMLGVWVAAEHIHPDAGRFFMLPRSHRTAVPGEERDPNGRTYKQVMADFVRSGVLPLVAPVLNQGDVLIWNAMAVHGSLPTADESFSRRSFTAHYIAASQEFTWKVGASHTHRTMLVNQVPVTLHGAQHSLRNNVVNTLRTDFPGLYQLAKATRPRRLLERVRAYRTASTIKP